MGCTITQKRAREISLLFLTYLYNHRRIVNDLREAGSDVDSFLNLLAFLELISAEEKAALPENRHFYSCLKSMNDFPSLTFGKKRKEQLYACKKYLCTPVTKNRDWVEVKRRVTTVSKQYLTGAGEQYVRQHVPAYMKRQLSHKVITEGKARLTTQYPEPKDKKAEYAKFAAIASNKQKRANEIARKLQAFG